MLPPAPQAVDGPLKALAQHFDPDKPSWLPRSLILSLGRVEFVLTYVARKMFVIAPFERLVEIAAAKQEDLHRKIDLRQARQPNSLHHARLLHYKRGAGT